VKRVVYLVALALVAMTILVPSAFAAQGTMMMKEDTMMMEQTMMQPLPKSGGGLFGGPAVVLPAAAALLLGSGILGYATFRRSR
jgi:hypothetical protein